MPPPALEATSSSARDPLASVLHAARPSFQAFAGSVCSTIQLSAGSATGEALICAHPCCGDIESCSANASWQNPRRPLPPADTKSCARKPSVTTKRRLTMRPLYHLALLLGSAAGDHYHTLGLRRPHEIISAPRASATASRARKTARRHARPLPRRARRRNLPVSPDDRVAGGRIFARDTSRHLRMGHRVRMRVRLGPHCLDPVRV